MKVKIPAREITSRWRFREVRAKWVRKYSKELTLDIGCYMGYYSRCCVGKYVGIDIVRWGPSLTVLADAQHLPIRDNCADLVLAFDVIEHLEDDNLFLRESKRVLKTDGRLLIIVVNFFSEHAWKNPDHKRSYNFITLCLKLLRYGLIPDVEEKKGKRTSKLISKLPKPIQSLASKMVNMYCEMFFNEEIYIIGIKPKYRKTIL